MFLTRSVARSAGRLLGFAQGAEQEVAAHGLSFLLSETEQEASPPPTPAPGVTDDALPRELVARHNGPAYRAPTDLRRSEDPITRVLIIGSCLSAAWMEHIKQDGLSFDYIVTNNMSKLPEAPPAPITSYDFQIVQIPLRSVLHENTYAHLPHADIGAYEDLFAQAKIWVSQYLDVILAWNTAHAITSFVTNFLVPIQSPLGRLIPRDDLRNMVYFIESLNAHLYREISSRTNVYLLDIDQISASVGKQTIQDDGVWTLSHGGILNDSEFPLDRARIQPTPRMSEHYPAIAEGQKHFYETAWAELVAMMRTLRRTDSVKLVVFDLDDTLWRGVIAEESEITSDNVEGWPVGLMETACFLKKRGVLLAIISRNDEARIVSLFDRIAGSRLRLADFAAWRINWRVKADNMAELLEEVHLVPENVVFVDDNPVERAAMQASFPEIRCLGAHPYYLRRILLWSAEAQTPFISDESARRTEMVQAQIVRDQQKSTMSREAFLATLELSMKLIDIRSADDRHFPRALELINKTNQFNTTGRRLTNQDCIGLFETGCIFHAFELQDRFSSYGLVGVAIVANGHIRQFVMSCRVLGLGAEDALLAHIATRAVVSGQDFISGDYIATHLNAPSRDLYARHGFTEHDGAWRARSVNACASPAHIKLEYASGAPRT
jgi:FkbH-like protein